MRHCKHTAKLGRKSEHRNSMLANLVCSLIKHRRVTTTLAKARAARPVAEKMVTLGKSGTIHDRRLAAARLHQEDAVRILFNEIAPAQQERPGGYTRIVKLNQRQGDAAALAILEWVDEALLEKPERPVKETTAESPSSPPAATEESKPVAPPKAASADEAQPSAPAEGEAPEKSPAEDKNT